MCRLTTSTSEVEGPESEALTSALTAPRGTCSRAPRALPGTAGPSSGAKHTASEARDPNPSLPGPPFLAHSVSSGRPQSPPTLPPWSVPSVLSHLPLFPPSPTDMPSSWTCSSLGGAGDPYVWPPPQQRWVLPAHAGPEPLSLTMTRPSALAWGPASKAARPSLGDQRCPPCQAIRAEGKLHLATLNSSVLSAVGPICHHELKKESGHYGCGPSSATNSVVSLETAGLPSAGVSPHLQDEGVWMTAEPFIPAS